MSDPDQVQAAVRAYAIPRLEAGKKSKPHYSDPKGWPEWSLITYCFTRPDASQRLTFGAYQVRLRNDLVDEGLFYADDLALAERRLLSATARQIESNVSSEGGISVVSRLKFLKEVFFEVAYEARGVVVGVELPFHLSRLAVDWGKARVGPYADGISLVMLEYKGKDGKLRPHAFYPRIGIKAIDSSRSLMGITSAWQKENPKNGSGEEFGRTYRGNFVDCLTLANAHTGARNNFQEACAAFGVSYSEYDLLGTGEVTLGAISSLRSRMNAIWELYNALLEAHWRHPISLPPDKTYSAASIGKAYLRDMGIETPHIEISPGLALAENEINGIAMTSYYGGRAECHIRGVPVPVTYCDFQSMYPTVFNLTELWKMFTAESIPVKDATVEVENLLAEIELDDLFDPKIWKRLTALVEVQPDNDILPIRADFSLHKNGSFNIALNTVSSRKPLWNTLADVVASKLITGKPPKIRRALKFGYKERQPNLRKTKLLSVHEVDPYQDDFFQSLVEARLRLASDSSLSELERKSGARGLKAIANATSYGIFIELHRKPKDPVEVDVYGLESFSCEVENVEEPGEFFFPIPATLMTGAARLMLAMLEEEVMRKGGAIAFMDTDSAAIVATEHGGLIPCRGGDHQTADGAAAIKALAWSDVEEIRSKFRELNPYNRNALPGSVLRLEDENFTVNAEGMRIRTQLECLAIASKRYVLFVRDEQGLRVIKASKHGLGNHVAPIDPRSGKQVDNWIEQAWLQILSEELEDLKPRPALAWANQIVRTRLRITTPAMLDWFRLMDKERGNPGRIRPFNSFDHALLPTLGALGSGSSKPICLVAPTSPDPPEKIDWINIHAPDEGPYRILHPERRHFDKFSKPGLTYAELIERHRFRTESKSLGPDGTPCKKLTKGVLTRRHTEVIDVIHIGKETNELELVQAGLKMGPDDVQLKYDRDEWHYLKQIIGEIPIDEILEGTGYSPRMVYALRAGTRRPSSKQMKLIRKLATAYASEHLSLTGLDPSGLDDLGWVRMYLEQAGRVLSQETNEAASPRY